MHAPAIAETNFMLCRVCICVHARGIHRQVEHVGSKAAMKEDVTVRVLRGVRKGLVADAASVDKPELLVRLAPVIRRQRNPSLQCDALGFVFEMKRLVGERITAKLGKACQLLLVAGGGRQFQHRPAIVGQRKSDARPR
jgi:hypothetical protein